MNCTPISHHKRTKSNLQDHPPDQKIFTQTILSPLAIDPNHKAQSSPTSPEPSRLSNQVLESLAIPSSSILSQLKKHEQFNFKLQMETPKRQQLFSKLKP